MRTLDLVDRDHGERGKGAENGRRDRKDRDSHAHDAGHVGTSGKAFTGQPPPV
jgi:hypothetical protein